jgi:hypothetical protein
MNPMLIEIQEIHMEPEGGLLFVERLSLENGQIISVPVLPTLSLSEFVAQCGLKNVNTTPIYYKVGKVSVEDFTLLRSTCTDHVASYGIAYKGMVARIIPTPSSEKQVSYLTGDRTVLKDELEEAHRNWIPRIPPNTLRQQLMEELLENL